VTRYSEPHRHYHTCAHIDHCLRQFDDARAHVPSPGAVEMALWFHDAVYDPGALGNERGSAELFLARGGVALAPGFARHVCELVMATTHDAIPDSEDAAFVVDIDLSGFGSDWEDFRRDGEAVRREFASVPDARFYRYQDRFLRALLARPSFYLTDFFRARYERRARENIERYLEQLAALGFA